MPVAVTVSLTWPANLPILLVAVTVSRILPGFIDICACKKEDLANFRRVYVLLGGNNGFSHSEIKDFAGVGNGYTCGTTSCTLV